MQMQLWRLPAAPLRTCGSRWRGAHTPTPSHVTSQKQQRQHQQWCRAVPWRPHVDDVDRLARGEGAKRRGTGSFHVPHRLNAEERAKFAAAKAATYLAVRGTGYRRERKGHPLPNSWRQWCDAKAQPCVVVELDVSGSNPDTVVVDLATLRASEVQVEAARVQLLRLAQRMGVTPLAPDARPADAVPFNIIPVAEGVPRVAFKQRQQHQQRTQLAAAARAAPQAAGVHPAHLPMLPSAARGQQQGADGTPHHLEAAGALLSQEADAAAREVRRLKEEEGWPNSAPVVKEAVARMKQLREQVEQLQRQASAPALSGRAARLFSEFGVDEPSAGGPMEAAGVEQEQEMQESAMQQANEEEEEDSNDEDESSDPMYSTAIWGIPAQPVFLTAPRAEAKAFAAQVVKELAAGVALTC